MKWRINSMLSTKENFVIQISKYTTFAVVQSPSRVQLFATPWTGARHRLLKFAWGHVCCIGDIIQPPHSLMPSSAHSLSQHQELFQWVGCLHQMTKSFSISPSKQYSGLISLKIDGFDLLAVQKTLRSLLQNDSSKVSILWRSAFFMVQLSQPYVTTGKTLALTTWTFVGRVMSLLFNILSRIVMAFLPRSKCLLIPWLHSPSTVILES